MMEDDQQQHQQEEEEELHDIATEGSDMTRDIQVALFKDNTRPACRSMPQAEMLLYTDIGSSTFVLAQIHRN